MIDFIKKTFKTTLSHKKMIAFLYAVNLIITLIFGFIAFQKLKESTGNSIEFEKLISTFDFTILSDFMRDGGEKLASLLPISFLLSALYLILNIYFSGGIIKQFQSSEKFNINIFITNATKYFGKFLLLFLIVLLFIIVSLILSSILYFVFVLIANGSTERGYFFWMIIPSSVMAISITFILNASDYAKVLLIENDTLNTWESFILSTKYAFKNPKTFRIYWLMIVVSLILFFIYSIVNSTIRMTSGFSIFIMIFVHQFFIFGKVFVKTWFQNNAFTYLQENPISIKMNEIEEENKLSES